MHYATPALLAAALGASLVPAQADAPTPGPTPQSQLVGRASAGWVVETVEAAAEEALQLAQAYPPAEVLSDAAPPPARGGATRHGNARTDGAVQLAQAPAGLRPPARSGPAAPAAREGGGTAANGNARPCSSVTVDPPTSLTLGKSQVVRLPFPVSRLIVGGTPGSRAGRPVAAEATGAGAAGAQRPTTSNQSAEGSDGVAEADVTLLSPTELFFLGRRTGTMNVVLQANDGRCLVKDLVVAVDPGALQAKLAELMPEESGVRVRGADNALVLSGSISDAVKLDQVLSVAAAFGDQRRLVNLLRVTAPQQVMLEVKIAEVSKTLLDRFGLDFTRIVTSANGLRTGIISGIVGGAPGVIGNFHPNVAGGVINGAAAGIVNSESAAAAASVSSATRGASLLGFDLQVRDGIFRVLAEPNIMAISGQAASFLSGGKIFIPVAQTSTAAGGTVITLEEKEFGVGLRFTPTVLDGRINLKIVSEVSELSQTGTPFTTVGNITAVLPSMTTRRVDTTVQLGDGQSFAVAGIIKNNVAQALDKFPGLGDAPVVGALFRSTEFQNDQTELMFVVTPRLVKPVTGPITLPTDNHVVPGRADVILRGVGEAPAAAPGGPAPAPAPQPAPVPATPQAVPAPAPASRP